jgi:hypothetical protein
LERTINHIAHIAHIARLERSIATSLEWNLHMLSGALRRATAVIVIVFWTMGGTLAPLADAHAVAGDAACGEPGWASPHPITQFEDVRPPVDDGHCELCHLQRIVRAAVQTSVLTASHDAGEPGCVSDGDSRIASALDPHLAPRAPPAR